MKKQQRERVDLTDTQRTALVALLLQRERVLNDANTALGQIEASLRELVRLFVGVDGYEVAQDESGTLYLQPREERKNGNDSGANAGAA